MRTITWLSCSRCWSWQARPGEARDRENSMQVVLIIIMNRGCLFSRRNHKCTRTGKRWDSGLMKNYHRQSKISIWLSISKMLIMWLILVIFSNWLHRMGWGTWSQAGNLTRLVPALPERVIPWQPQWVTPLRIKWPWEPTWKYLSKTSTGYM